MIKCKSVLVVGGAGLLGAALAEEIINSGGTAVIGDLNFSNAHSVSQRLSDSGGSSAAVELDMTDASSIRNAIDDIVQRFGVIDAVVNTAYPRNQNYGKQLEEVTYSSFCENLNLHLGGYFLVSKIFGEYFLERGEGQVINFASIYGLVAPRFEVYEETEMTMPVEYAAIKSGVIALTRYLAKYYLGRGPRFNVIAPGGVRDGQSLAFQKAYDSHAGTVGLLEPADVAGVVNFLLSDKARAINGQTLVIDDGWTL